MGDRLATIDVGRKVGATVPLSVGELGLRLRQCLLGRGLRSYQVASSSIQPLGHNHRNINQRLWPQQTWAVVYTASVKRESGGYCAPFSAGAGFLSNTMCPGPVSTSVLSGILIHPTVGHTNVTDRAEQDNSQLAQGEPFYKQEGSKFGHLQFLAYKPPFQQNTTASPHATHSLSPPSTPIFFPSLRLWLYKNANKINGIIRELWTGIRSLILH